MREDQIPEVSARIVRRAVVASFDGLSAKIHLPLAAGGSFGWVVAEPGRLVAACLDASSDLRQLFSSRCAGRLHIILSHDEVTPGALLRPENKRKFSSFYFLSWSSARLRYATSGAGSRWA